MIAALKLKSMEALRLEHFYFSVLWNCITCFTFFFFLAAHTCIADCLIDNVIVMKIVLFFFCCCRYIIHLCIYCSYVSRVPNSKCLHKNIRSKSQKFIRESTFWLKNIN